MRISIRVLFLVFLLSAVAPVLALGSSFTPDRVPTDVPITVQATFWFDIASNLSGISLSIQNQSDETVTVLWDESSVVDPSGLSQRIIHTGVRFMDKAQPQAPTPIPPDSRVEVSIWPADRFVFVLDTWLPRPIPVKDGESLRINLTWRTPTGGQRSASWSWRATIVERSPVFWISAVLGVLVGLGLLILLLQ